MCYVGYLKKYLKPHFTKVAPSSIPAALLINFEQYAQAGALSRRKVRSEASPLDRWYKNIPILKKTAAFSIKAEINTFKNQINASICCQLPNFVFFPHNTTW